MINGSCKMRRCHPAGIDRTGAAQVHTSRNQEVSHWGANAADNGPVREVGSVEGSRKPRLCVWPHARHHAGKRRLCSRDRAVAAREWVPNTPMLPLSTSLIYAVALSADYPPACKGTSSRSFRAPSEWSCFCADTRWLPRPENRREFATSGRRAIEMTTTGLRRDSPRLPSAHASWFLRRARCMPSHRQGTGHRPAFLP